MATKGKTPPATTTRRTAAKTPKAGAKASVAGSSGRAGPARTATGTPSGRASTTRAKGASHSTSGGPARPNADAGAAQDRLAQRDADVQRLAASMPENTTKPFEIGRRNAIAPQPGMMAPEPPSGDA